MSFLALCLAAASPVMAAPFAYVPNTDTGNVVVFNDAAVLTTVAVGSGPSGVAVNSAGTFAYVANAGAGTVSVIRVSDNTVVDTISFLSPVVPDGVAVSPDDTRVWVTTGNGTLAMIDVTVSPPAVTPITTTARTLRGIVAVGSRAYVADIEAGNVLMVDPGTSPVTIVTIPVGTPPDSRPMGIVASQSSSRSRVWVVDLITTNPDFNMLEVSGIDTDAASLTFNQVVERIEVLRGLGFSPAGLAVSSDGNLLYVAIDGTNQVAVVSTQTGAATFNVGAGPTFVNVGAGPFGVAINPLGTRVYVGNALSASVSVIDTTTNAVIATVSIGTMPFVFGAFATDGPQTSPGPGPGPTPAPPSCEDKISELKAKVAGLKYHHRGYLKLRAALRMRAAALVEIDKAKAKAGASDPRVLRAEREFKKGDTALCANHYWRAGHEYWQAYEIAHHVLKYYRYHRR